MGQRDFHLGRHLKVRLPTAAAYVPQVEKEHRWLPRLAPHLPVAIRAPRALGVPDEGYPWPWSIYQWIDGDTASAGSINDPAQFAVDVAGFLIALQRIDTDDGPPSGTQNFFRGGSLHVYDAETRQTIERLQGRIDPAPVAAVWDAALAADWSGPPVWLHGDISVGNLLVRDGRLSAVIDFGSCAVGDPACDLVIAWTFLKGSAQEAFRQAVSADHDTWARARGWALWKALLTLADNGRIHPAEAPSADIIADIVAEHRKIR